ncbi:molybdopterin synthase catalytic subunit MoaE [Parashewanella spongiae]|uniref:Molybdopterin synthase catalytic subunit n=1 Tax=Parashewanella spongiae TaxID=342950 RepID=A0A3A6UHM3_9GAMM|nr:molybdopterin synthase catalytic subunit MoaE [Parashewanella spongiae]MCL1078066.1 molybdopterin synthase catalytic subunit MoaE [Parashewanella spongiae]RJY16940.1 molybdopterin synthase catalytic subunit MoaE [Parashewanella spongiae]
MLNTSCSTTVRVQQNDFSLADEYEKLNQDQTDGAVVTFIGKVRDFNDGSVVTDLSLEHYPGMTEKVLNDLVADSRHRWPINHVTIIHRVGTMALGEQIVFIGVTSMHRQAAFNACEFLIDFLKTKAPFWKLESTLEGEKWVDARDSDTKTAEQWQ